MDGEGSVYKRIFVSPNRYVQGPGIIREAGKYIKNLGKQLLVIADEFVLRMVEAPLRESLEKEGLSGSFKLFAGESSAREIARLTELASKESIEAVVGVGGGKVLDTGRAVAFNLGVPCIVIPTIAATDSPTSSYALIYSEDGVFERVLFCGKNPDLILVDSEIIINAPTRFLVSGMGDALATWFEADACTKSRAKLLPGGQQTILAMAIARACYETLVEYGAEAKTMAEKHILAPAVEKVIEANILLSGLGFENGGLAAAHAIHNGLTSLTETHKYYHGEKVAFSLIAQLIMEERENSVIDEVIEFCLSVGLPVCLADLGVTDCGFGRIMEVARLACQESESIHNEPFEVTPELVASAIIAADLKGTVMKSKTLG